MARTLKIIGALVTLAAAVYLVGVWRRDSGIYIFAGVAGPAAKSVIRPPMLAKPDNFGGGSVHRLAVLVTDPNSGWLGLARGLRAHGIPFTMTTNVAKALTHSAVFVYPMISGRVLGADDFDKLRKHVSDGGAILAFDVEGGGLSDMFGVSGPPTTAMADQMSWVRKTGVTEDDTIRVNRQGTEAKVGALSYQPTTAQTIANYGDGSVALACRKTAGTACVFGVDVGALSSRALTGREEAVARSYVNGYEPALDTIYRWIGQFYVDADSMPWLIDTAPAGKDVTILLTHDIDFTASVKSAAAYASAFAKMQTKSTFFMQTKYVRDFNDDVFFNDSTLPDVKSVLAMNMEVGSHSVAHSNAMKHFPIGDGTEAYPSYRPFVQTRATARDASIFGELRVSRYLLQQLAGADVASFRAGYLSNPFALPQVLAASGYRYDSSITANSTLMHLPYQLTYDRADTALVPVYEFPVTIEDEAGPALIDRLDAANTVIAKIARAHGLAVVLVHPNTATRKLEFEQKIIERWAPHAWLTSMRIFGDWWSARDRADIDVTGDSSGWTVKVDTNARLDGLVVRLPKAHLPNSKLPKGITALGQQLTIFAAPGTLSATWH